MAPGFSWRRRLSSGCGTWLRAFSFEWPSSSFQDSRPRGSPRPGHLDPAELACLFKTASFSSPPFSALWLCSSLSSRSRKKLTRSAPASGESSAYLSPFLAARNRCCSNSTALECQTARCLRDSLVLQDLRCRGDSGASSGASCWRCWALGLP